MAICSLFSDALALLNGVGVSTGEALAIHVITWLDRKARGFPILPLLTACSRCLASVRHMTRIMEACVTAYFNHGSQNNGFVLSISHFDDFTENCRLFLLSVENHIITASVTRSTTQVEERRL